MIAVQIAISLFLTLAWCILAESFSLVTIAAGAVAGILCAFFSNKYLPLGRIRGISLLRLLTYPLYMLAQIYMAALSGIKMVLTNASAGIIELKTVLSNDLLKILLSHSATLTPGTVTLDLTGDKVTLLCLIGNKNTQQDSVKNVRRIEKRLLWAQKRKEKM